jgi:hypothetical protein
MVDSVVSSFSLTFSLGHEELDEASPNGEEGLGLGGRSLTVPSFMVSETFSLSKSISKTLTLTLWPTETTSIGLVT